MTDQAKAIEALDNEIASLSNRIAGIAEALPYADGQAYRDDKRRMSELQGKLVKLKREREQLNGA